MPRQAKWNIYEAAILLDAYLKVDRGELTRPQAVEHVSRVLRDRAVSAGKSIDDVYRNTNGINYQFSVLQYVMTDGRRGLPHLSKLFKEIVRIYRCDPDEYARLLEQAISDGETGSVPSSDASSTESEPDEAIPVQLQVHESDNTTPRHTDIRQAEVEEAPRASMQERAHDDRFLAYLDSMGVEYIDRRNKNGCLWVVGDEGLKDVAAIAKRQGIFLRFSKNGGRLTKGKSAWWTKQSTVRFIEPPERREAIRDDVATASLSDEYLEALGRCRDNLSTPEADEFVIPASKTYPNTSGGFKEWLIDHEVDAKTAKDYSFAIAIAGNLARECHIIESGLYGCGDVSALSEIVTSLRNRRIFQRKDRDQNMRLSQALEWYIRFVGSVTASHQSASKEPKHNASAGVTKSGVRATRRGAAEKTDVARTSSQTHSSTTRFGETDNRSRTATFSGSRVGSGPSGKNSAGYECSEDGFKRWMLDSGMALGSANNYVRSLRTIDKARRDQGLTGLRLFDDCGLGELAARVQRLSKELSFDAYGAAQQRLLKASLNKFRAFISALAVQADGDGVDSTATGQPNPSLANGPLAEVEQASAPDDLNNETALSQAKARNLTQEEHRIVSLVRSKLPNGFRLGSIIEENRIRNLYRTEYGDELGDAIDISSLMLEVGLEWNGRVYLIDEGVRQAAAEQIESAVCQGMRIFYYSELYDAKREYYARGSIQSPEALAGLLKTIVRLNYYKNYAATQSDITLEDEVLRAYADDLKLSIEMLHNRLPYVPEAKLLPVLSVSTRFVRVKNGEYAVADRIDFDANEVDSVAKAVIERVNRDGFCSLGMIDLPLTLEANPTLTGAAIRDAFYNRYLSARLDRKGQIASQRGGKMSASDIMRSYCRSLDMASLADLDAFEESLTGKMRNSILTIAFSTMVRTTQDTFISDNHVKFDAERIDYAISLFVGDGIAPITAITSFTSFPDIEMPWSLYLLESYLKRFSARYRIMGGPVRTANIGAIYPAAMEFDTYEELLATVLAETNIELEAERCGDYLVQLGFVARRTSLIEAATERARTLRDYRGQ